VDRGREADRLPVAEARADGGLPGAEESALDHRPRRGEPEQRERPAEVGVGDRPVRLTGGLRMREDERAERRGADHRDDEVAADARHARMIAAHLGAHQSPLSFRSAVPAIHRVRDPAFD
jgi:hypothetical protein